MHQQIIDRSYVGEVLQRIYESDFNMKVTLITEGGYFYTEVRGSKTPLQGTTVEEAITHLGFALAREFPSSKFAEWWRQSFTSNDELLQRSN